jgi:hypothetical protein
MNSEHPQKIPARNQVLMLLVYIFIAYLLLLALIRVFESHLVFFPNYPSRLEGDRHPSGLAIEDVWLTASDGTKLYGWWIPNPLAKFTFLAFHGNACNIANRAPTYESLRSVPADVVELEYPTTATAMENPGKPVSTATPKLPINIWSQPNP